MAGPGQLRGTLPSEPILTEPLKRSLTPDSRDFGDLPDITIPLERPPRLPTLYRYVLREIAVPFGTALLVFTGLLFLSKSLKLLELVVSRTVSLTEIVQIFALIIPQFLEIALPMAFLLGLILAFGRLSGDSELTVMRACGLSLRELIRPVSIAALLVFSVSLIVSMSVRPWANNRLERTLFQLAKQRMSSGLVAGVFNEMGALTVYAEKVESEGNRLVNVIIADRRDTQQRIFLAKYGQILSNEENRTLNLKLFDGTIHEGRGLNYNITSFDSNSVILSEAELLNDDSIKEGKKATEMSFIELTRSISALREKVAERGPDFPRDETTTKLQRQLVEWHRRFALPASCLAVGVIGMVLGIQPSRQGKSWGMALNITVGILVITLYYFALAFATALGEQSVVPPWFAIWLPNCVFAGLAWFLYRRMESEEWMAVSQALIEFLERTVKRFRWGGA